MPVNAGRGGGVKGLARVRDAERIKHASGTLSVRLGDPGEPRSAAQVVRGLGAGAGGRSLRGARRRSN